MSLKEFKRKFFLTVFYHKLRNKKQNINKKYQEYQEIRIPKLKTKEDPHRDFFQAISNGHHKIP